MTNSIDNSLEFIIQQKKIDVYFQPVVNNFDGTIWGYEALIRGPSNSAFHSPIKLFEAANNQERLLELELLSRELSIQQFKTLNLPGKLFLNVSPKALSLSDYRSEKTLEILSKNNLPPQRIIIELTKNLPSENDESVSKALKHYREMGFEIAMDDLGSNYSGLRMWYELKPDYIKVDRHLMCNINSDKEKQEYLLSIKDIAQKLNCTIIAEKVETQQEFEFIKKIGLPLSQGYYFTHPAEQPIKQLPIEFFINKRKINFSFINMVLPKKIAILLQSVETVSSSTSIVFCSQLFNNNPDLESIPVVDDEKPIGLIRRSNLTNKLFTDNNSMISGKTNIASLVEKQVLTLESDLLIEKAESVIQRQTKKYKTFKFIITQDGRYQGIGSLIDLLEMISILKNENKRYANPLTLLPGNVAISKKLNEQLTKQSPFVICYVDLNHFQAYTDFYGDKKSNQIIIGLGNFLREIMTGDDDFIGHISEDDFILFLSPENWEQQCNKLLEDFSDWVRLRYRPVDQMMGGISTHHKADNNLFSPLMSLSIDCVHVPSSTDVRSHESAILAMQKKLKEYKNSVSLFYNSPSANQNAAVNH